jgi:hypothetical protein
MAKMSPPKADTSLVNFLSGFKEEKLKPLCIILKINDNDIQLALAKKPSSRSLAKIIWAGLEWRAKGPATYREILMMAAEKMELPKKGTIEKLETMISQKAFAEFVSQLSTDQKGKLEKELIAIGIINRKSTIGGIINLLLNPKISQFPGYIAAATSLDSPSSAMAIESMYKNVLLKFFGWSWLQPNYKVIIPAILYIAALRNEKYLPAGLQDSE